jgi:hypothetical protein
MKSILPLCALFFALCFVAFSGEGNCLPVEFLAALAAPKKVTLFSLEPEIDRPIEAQPPKPHESHHGFKVLGSTELAQEAPRTAAIDAIKKAVAAFDGTMARCFEPRHSLRVLTDKGVTYDLVVCFQCDQLRMYRDAKELGTVGVTASSKALDDLLTRANVPLPKGPRSPARNGG